ncbi:MAG: PepSY domain-containing protein [Rhizobiaceae bacterium]|nr:PepSY domain-containing protein [Rhizobiaceae bacterium]
MRSFVLSAAALTFLSGAAFAENRCNAPTDQWQAPEKLQAQLEKEGWKIRKIKTDNGCYEVYATDAAGKRKETYFDPVTLQPVGEDDD